MMNRIYIFICRFFNVYGKVNINYNGWDDFKNDPNWKDYSKELPDDNQKVLISYLEQVDSNDFKINYEQVIYNREVDENYLILNWKKVD